MFEFIKPGTRYPFMSQAKYWIVGTSSLVILSIVLLLTRGLNLGIDFKGGTKLIVAFPETSQVTRDQVRDVIAETIKASSGKEPGQLEVQDYSVGSTDAQGRKVNKYQIYTEMTTLLDNQRAAAVEEAIKQAVPVDRIDRAEETDKFIVVLKTPQPVVETKAKLKAVLNDPKRPDLSFSKAEVESEEEQAYDMDFYKEYNLSVVERQKEGKDIPEDDFQNAFNAHEEKKKQALAARTDVHFTVSLAQLQTDVEEALIQKFGKENVEVESATSVSPSVGSDLFSQGMLALLYAIIGMLIYIGVRFDFRYSPGVILALIHDAVLTLGVFSLFQLQFTLPTISAILTIIGYSVNDTIVVYDRIRENTGKLKGMDLRDIIDRSINETLSRTILTSTTTILSILPLIFLGGGMISDFALAMVFGFSVGTYSSIFIASPLVILVDEWAAHRRARAAQAPTAATGA